MADFISSRPVDQSRDNQEHLVKEMVAIQRDGGAKEMRATIEGGYVWLEGWRENPADPVTGDWPAFEPAYTLQASRGNQEASNAQEGQRREEVLAGTANG